MTSKEQSRGLAAYATVTTAYWAFMLTDGALRMLVLLHFHTLGFSPVQLAYLFVLYELAGMATNLSAGWIAARFGLTSTLHAGLTIQIFALLALTQLDSSWSVSASVAFVMMVQGVSGVAKDLSKMSAKSAVKLLAPRNGDGLFRWVAYLTGSKNAVKGIGFLLGTLMLGTLGFSQSLVLMAIALSGVLIAVVLVMPKGLPTGRRGAKFKEVFSTDRNVNLLSLARIFLFGARDVWFVVGIPIYFYSVLSDGSEAGDRMAFFRIGVFMALWVIAYGAVQAAAPKLLKAKEKNTADIVDQAVYWARRLTLVPAALALLVVTSAPASWLPVVLVAGLLTFGFVFAINSSIHSYLILAFTKDERVTMDVGFYYMSNAAGRLLGTLLSGLSYQVGGLSLCLATSAAMAAVSWRVASRLQGNGETA